MRFLCVPCDEPMGLERTEGPDAGSLTAVFVCPRCGHSVALLTNPMETQLVQALNLRVGPPAATDAAAASFTHAALADPGPVAPGVAAGACPFAAGAPAGPARGEVPGEPAERVVWTAEADERLRRIPAGVRQMAARAIEEQARRRGVAVVTVELMEQVKQSHGK